MQICLIFFHFWPKVTQYVVVGHMLLVDNVWVDDVF